MRVVLGCLFVLLLSIPVTADDDHQTASAEVAIGASLEVLPRSRDLGTVGVIWGLSTWTSVRPERERPSATRSVSAQQLALGTFPADSPEPFGINTMYARAFAKAVSSNDGARARALARPSLDLLNELDEWMPLTLLLRIPGRFPSADGPSAYYMRGSADDNYAEYTSALQLVKIIPWWNWDPMSREGREIVAFAAFRENRLSLDPGSAGPGPSSFDTFGVPFQEEFRISVPPSIVHFDGIVDIRLYQLMLWVEVDADTVSALDASAPVVFKGIRSFCEKTASPTQDELFPDLDPLCRAGRADAPAFCKCTRDLNASQQRCTFTFPDFQVVQEIPAPALPGQPVEVEWTIHPSADGGEYWFKPEMYLNGEWVSIGSKQKLGGKLMAGKASRTKMTFTMPERPVLLRTQMFHQPDGAKQPIESQIDTVVAMRKAKPQ